MMSMSKSIEHRATGKIRGPRGRRKHLKIAFLSSDYLSSARRSFNIVDKA